MSDYVILGDWGTSSRRLYLCRREGDTVSVLEERRGKGVKFERTFEHALASDIEPWVRLHGNMPVILSGMIGSSIGWVETPYATCPAGADALFVNAVRFQSCGCDIVIIPGVECRNPLGLPDVMRGEEIQLYGWRAAQDAQTAKRLACLPGTHSKWAIVDTQGRIETFVTGLQGELFSLLRSNSVLIPEDARNAPTDALSFETAVTFLRDTPDATLLHVLFSTRARQVLGDLNASEASAYLCGLIIGSDVRAAVGLFHAKADLSLPIPVIGSEENAALYLKAFGIFGLTAAPMSSTDASTRGLIDFYQTGFETP